MKEKTFERLVLIVIAVCLMLTLIHLAFVIHGYLHCSIIEFIAKEPW